MIRSKLVSRDKLDEHYSKPGIYLYRKNSINQGNKKIKFVNSISSIMLAVPHAESRLRLEINKKQYFCI